MMMCQVPWSQLGTQPVVLEMDRVYVLVSPLTTVQTPEEQVSRVVCPAVCGPRGGGM